MIGQRYWSNGADNRFAVQAAFAAYSVPAQSDKFYDLAGSLGFISTTLVSLVCHLYSSSRLRSKGEGQERGKVRERADE
jgi:hypothetical protein